MRHVNVRTVRVVLRCHVTCMVSVVSDGHEIISITPVGDIVAPLIDELSDGELEAVDMAMSEEEP